jgi:trimeric autotransporter adhesin
MTGSKRVFSRSGMSLASVAALLALAACGGGGGGGGGGFPFVGVAPPPPAPAPPAAQKLEVKVVDGVLRNANVFLDKNNNGLLDSGEPSGRTDTAGKVTLEIDAADAGKYPVVALVGTDAVDAELGPVP